MDTTIKAAGVKQLASALAAIGAQGEKVEATAVSLLKAIKTAGVRSLEQYGEAVKAAYDLNGWNTRQGRPTAEKRSKVPTTVRTYVWELRAAIKEDIKVWEFKTMYDIRMARAKLRRKAASAPPVAANDPVIADLPELEGVRVSHAEAPTGSLFHDLILTFAALEDDRRLLLARNLARLLKQYRPDAIAATPSRKRSTG